MSDPVTNGAPPTPELSWRGLRTPRLLSVRGHHVLTDLLSSSSVVVDLGAHVGQFSSEISNRFGCVCYAAEANPALYAHIPRTDLIRPFNVAVAGSSGLMSFEISDNLETSHLSGGGNFATAPSAISVEGLTLPDFVREAGLTKIDLLKVDIEGAELELFDSLSDAFVCGIAQITVEFHDFIQSLACGADVARIKKRLEALGFACIVFSSDNNGDVLFVNRGAYLASPLQWVYLEHVARYTRGLMRRTERWLGKPAPSVLRSVDGYEATRSNASEPSAVGRRTLEIFANTSRLNSWIYSKLVANVRGDVLEIGSGIGNLSRLILADADRLVATDVEAPYLDALRRTFENDPRVQVTKFDLDDQAPESIASRRFDAIIAVNVIEHIKDDYSAVTRLASLLKPGGHLLVYVPACPSAFGTLDEALGHHRRYTPGMLTALLRSGGLDPLPPRYMNLLGLFGWMLNGRGFRRQTLSAKQVFLFEHLVPFLRIEDFVRLPIGLGIFTSAKKADAEAGS